MSGGLDARSLQDRANNIIDGELSHDPALVQLARDVLVLLDERERLEASLRDAHHALVFIAAPARPDGSYNRDREACGKLAREALARLAVGERASLDSPEAQQ